MQSSDDPGKRQLRPSEVPEYRVRPRDPEPGYGPMEGTGSGGSVGTAEVGWVAGLGTGALEATGSVGTVEFCAVGLAGAGADRDGCAVSSSTSPGGSPGG